MTQFRRFPVVGNRSWGTQSNLPLRNCRPALARVPLTSISYTITRCRLLHCIHTTYNMQKHCQKRNYVLNRSNININIIFVIRYTLDNILILAAHAFAPLALSAARCQQCTFAAAAGISLLASSQDTVGH